MDENDASGTRVRYTDHQLQRLEEVFGEHSFISGEQTATLSLELGISLKQTRTWFQNRRAKIRRHAIRAEGKNYVPKLSPGSIRISRTPPSPNRVIDKMASAAGSSKSVLKPSDSNYGHQFLDVPAFSSDSRSPSDSPVLSSADEEDVFLSVPSCAEGQPPDRKYLTAEPLSKSAPTSGYMEAARNISSADLWQVPIPTHFAASEASARETGLVGVRSSSLPRCSGPMNKDGSDDVMSRHWLPAPGFVHGADSSELHGDVSWPSVQGRQQTTSISSVTSLIIDMENSCVTRDAHSSLDTSTSLVDYFLNQDENYG